MDDPAHRLTKQLRRIQPPLTRVRAFLNRSQPGASVVEDDQVELAQARGVGEHLDLRRSSSL